MGRATSEDVGAKLAEDLACSSSRVPNRHFVTAPRWPGCHQACDAADRHLEADRTVQTSRHKTIGRMASGMADSVGEETRPTSKNAGGIALCTHVERNSRSCITCDDGCSGSHAAFPRAVQQPSDADEQPGERSRGAQDAGLRQQRRGRISGRRVHHTWRCGQTQRGRTRWPLTSEKEKDTWCLRPRSLVDGWASYLPGCGLRACPILANIGALQQQVVVIMTSRPPSGYTNSGLQPSGRVGHMPSRSPHRL